MRTQFAFTDLELQAAAKLVRRAKMAEIKQNTIDHVFPADFDKKVFALKKKIKIVSFGKSVRQGLIAALFTAVMIGSLWMAVSTEARAAVSKYLRTLYENFIVYTSSVQQDTSSLSLDYELTWAPAPLTLLDESENASFSFKVYLAEDGNMFSIKVIRISKETTQLYVFDTDAGTAVTVSGLPGFYYAAEEGSITNTLVWSNADETLLFVLDTTTNQTTTIQIAENIAMVNQD